MLDDFVTCFLTDREETSCLHCFPSSSLQIATVFILNLRMEHDIANPAIFSMLQMVLLFSPFVTLIIVFVGNAFSAEPSTFRKCFLQVHVK